MTRTPARARRAPLGFAWRLMVALGLVVLAGGLTLLGVALAIAPQIFRSHLLDVPGGAIEPGLQARACRQQNRISPIWQALNSGFGRCRPFALWKGAPRRHVGNRRSCGAKALAGCATLP